MRMTLSCRVVSGNSGAPMLRKTPDGLEIAGIVIATGRRDGQRGPVTLAVQARSRILQIEAVSGP